MLDFHTPSTFTDENLCTELAPFVAEIVGSDKLAEAPCQPTTEDFGYVTEKSARHVRPSGCGQRRSRTDAQSEHVHRRKRPGLRQRSTLTSPWNG